MYTVHDKQDDRVHCRCHTYTAPPHPPAQQPRTNRHNIIHNSVDAQL